MRVHRVGTFTLGATLIACGVVFLLQQIIPALTFSMVCRLWPVIFIVLGIEILISNWRDKEGTFIYDKGSIFLSFLVTCFAMVLGFVCEAAIMAQSHISF